MKSFIRNEGAEIARLGYPVCAIRPGDKAPMGKDWNHHPLSAAQCAAFTTPLAAEAAGVGAGILCGVGAEPVYGIDCDIAGDAKAAAEVREMIRKELDAPGCLYRVGCAPKFLIPVLGEEAGWKKAASPWFEKSGTRARIEVLGAGQQFVAFAIHPATGNPYEWRGEKVSGGVIDPPAFLPPASAEQISTILKKAGEILRANGWAEAGGGAEMRGASDLASADELAPQYPMGISIEDARRWLQDFPGSEDYEQWIRVGMALKHEFGRRPEAELALDLWDEWSRTAANYSGYEAMARKWDSFRGAARSVTCRWLQYEWAKRHHDKASEMNAAGRAARLTAYFRGSLKYCKDLGSWFQWNGQVWRRLCDAEIRSCVRFVLDDLLRADIEELERRPPEPGDIDEKTGVNKKVERARKFYQTAQNGNLDDPVMRLAKATPVMWADSGDFDSDPRWLGVGNGVVDLQELKLVPADPSMGVTLQMGCDFDPDARCPSWEQTVSEIFFGREDLIRYFQRMAGYTVLGHPVLETMNILYGTGSNGKSTLINVLKGVFGDYACAASSDLLTSVGRTSQNLGSARADLVALRKKRLLVVSELDQRARMREAAMKSLVSTDTLSARGLYAAEMTYFKPTWVVYLLTNYLPRIDGGDTGVWRRLRTIPFDRNFETDRTVKKDPDRADKLRAEWPGILNWILDGVRQFRAEGLEPPERVRNETAEYKTQSDVLQEWMDERLVRGEGQSVPTSVAWASWDAWAKQSGLDHAISDKNRLTREMARRGFKVSVRRIGGKSTRCYSGIGLNEGEAL